jgi:hypothetical protein
MKPIDLTNARPDPNWDEKKQLGWDVLAEKVIELLQTHDNTHDTYYAYYLNQGPEGKQMLSKCLAEANKRLTWKEVARDGGSSNTKFRTRH